MWSLSELGLQHWTILLLAPSALYFVRKCIQGNSRSPPVVPYWIPWLGSAVAMGKDPDGFFKKACNELGPVFRILAAGQDITYVTSPGLIANIYRDSKTFEFTPIRLDVNHRALKVPREVAYSPIVTDLVHPEHNRILSPKNVHTILDEYIRHAYSHLTQKIQDFDGAETPLLNLVIPPAYSAAAKAFYGDTFPAEATYEGFTKFNDVFHLLAGGFPGFMMPGAIKAWSGVQDIITTYLQDLRKSGKHIPDLVNLFIAAGHEGGWSDHWVATLLATDLWAIEANAIYAVYWLIALVLQNPDNLQAIVAEIDSARHEWIAAHPETPLSESTFSQFMKDITDKLPLLTSGIQETLRLCTSSFSIRRVAEPTEFAGYHFNVGDRLICATRAVHMDEEIYEKPSEFVLDRYLDPQKKFTKGGKVVPNYHLPFGGGVSMCEGRHFAMAEIKAFLVILLTHATIEVSEETSWPELATERLGVGILQPKGDVNIIVRRRNTS